jgi:excisionase family DNA binding protein
MKNGAGDGKRDWIKERMKPLAVGVPDAAAAVGISERGMRGLIASGKVPATRIGGRVLVRTKDLEELLEKGVAL